jgi:xanthine dehydrogenase small subunit
MTTFLAPRTLDEALAARRANPDFVVLAGGTDLLVGAHRRPEPPGVIDLFGLVDLVGVTVEADGSVVIGAATPFAAIARSVWVGRELPCLAAAAREVGALQIQNRATLGGNIATSSPVGDSLPVLLALDAEIEVASQDGQRIIPYQHFCTGYRRTALGPDELIVAVRVPPRPPGLRQFWRKVGTRRAQSIAKVSVAATGRVAGGAVAELRIGLGAVADRPVRARAVEAAVIGQPVGGDLGARAAAALAGEIRPIDDVRSTAAYRLAVAQSLVRRFVQSLSEEPG